MNQIKILFTGGGTAGHVTPNIALIDDLKNKNFEIFYIGSKGGIEEDLIGRESIKFFKIVSDKIRREMSFKNLLTPFKVLLGILQSIYFLLKLRPNLVFSKGGYVAFPVVFAAWCLRIPVIAHESDFSPGLANRMSFPFVKKICVTFEKGSDYFSDKSKVVVTGTPIRRGLLEGDSSKGAALCGFKDGKPVLMVVGGSQGSLIINKTIRDNLEKLLPLYNIIHICGKGKVEPSLSSDAYCQFEYVHGELSDLLAYADLVISRAGANMLYELLRLGKPSLLIPLSRRISRGDQIQNADYFEAHGYADVILEDDLGSDKFLSVLKDIQLHLQDWQNRLKSLQLIDSNQAIIEIMMSQINYSNKT